MAVYRVIKHFTDLQDNNYSYIVGDAFPHDGVSVSQERIDELSGPDNRQGVPLIEVDPAFEDEVKETEPKAPKRRTRKKKE